MGVQVIDNAVIVSSGQQMFPFSLKLTTAFKHVGFSFLTLNSTLNIIIPDICRYYNDIILNTRKSNTTLVKFTS